MPNVSLTLDDTNRSILSQAYYKIIQDIVEAIKLPYSSVVVMHKDIEVSLTDNKSNASGLSEGNLPSTASLRRIQTNITENYNEDELTTTAVHQLSAFPIFEDRDINVFIYPIYVKSDVTIDFTYISPSKTEATRIRDDIRLRLSQTRNITIHDVEYDIFVPKEVEEFIADIHELKNRLVPQNLEDYFREHSSKRMHLITDMTNKENTKLAVFEKQVRIVGLFDFSSMPEKLEIDNENSTYKITFSYKLSLDVPRAIGIKYPVMICNKPLPSKYLQFIEDHKVNSQEEYKRNLGYTNSLHALSHFEAHRQLENRVDINLPINVPLFDDFNIRQGHKGYCILASFLTDINETDKRSLMNLREIDPYYIPDKLLNFIELGENGYIINPYMSFLYLGLHQDDLHFDNNILTIDSNLNIKSNIDLSLMKPTRVTLSFILDLTLLDRRALQRLLDNEDILLIFIEEYIRVYNNFKTEMRSANTLPDNTFYRTFILILNYYLSRNNNAILKAISDIIRQDSYLFNNLSTILSNNYPDMFRYLNKYDCNLPVGVQNVGHTNIENYGMRTVESTYVVALRRDK